MAPIHNHIPSPQNVARAARLSKVPTALFLGGIGSLPLIAKYGPHIKEIAEQTGSEIGQAAVVLAASPVAALPFIGALCAAFVCIQASKIQRQQRNQLALQR